ncbi:Ig-like domain-containing protein [Rummeliibacillus sp. TYF-LIM-RU47]|uniref:Ig-like domain-containing protein n=1 Tax=unclassified Rummeliibacillus TaxID=2622809 RepID=UPI0012391D3B|nr:Ig-like domain-containing protein [Rummeliibacillus sp. TYF-LIM-RU47]
MKKNIVVFMTSLILCLSIVIPAYAANIVVSFSTDKSDYKTGEKILITGKVLKDEEPGLGTKPVLSMVDSDSNLIQIYQWKDGEIQTDGSIHTSIALNESLTDGTYKLKLTAGGVSDTHEVKITKTTQPPSTGGGDSGTTPPSTGGGDSGTTPPPVVTPPGNPGDTTDPVLPVPVPEFSPITSESLVIKGTASKNTKIEITDKKQLQFEANTQDNGEFTYQLSQKLEAGTVLYAKARDLKSGQASDEVTITVLDKTAPSVPTVKKFSDKDKVVSGKTEARATIIIYKQSKKIATNKADSKGSFTVKLAKQKAGTTLIVKSVDEAGNSSKGAKVKVLDKTAPNKPTAKKVTAKTTKITGKAEAGSKVYVKVKNKIIAKTTATKKGTYTLKIKKQKVKTVLSFYAKDKAGNVSKAKVVKVVK